MTLTIATTIAPYILDKEQEYWDRWMHNAHDVIKRTKEEQGIDARYFAAIEVDARGLAPYEACGFYDRLMEIGGQFWTYTIDDGNKQYHSDNRIIRICTGRNLAQHYAQVNGDQWLCCLDADISIPDNGVVAMLEMDYPLVGLNVPTYGLRGPSAGVGDDPYPHEWNVQTHFNTAGCLLMERKVFLRVKWRVDGDAGMTDDPCFHEDAKALGWATHVRHDITGTHYPTAIGPIETRHDDREIRLS